MTAVPKRTTRSTRSNSAATQSSVVNPVVEQNYPEPIREVAPTPQHAKKTEVENVQDSSEDDQILDRDRTGSKGRSVLRPKPSKYIPVPRGDDTNTPGLTGKKLAVPPQDSDEGSESPLDQDEAVESGAEVSDMDEDDENSKSSLPFRLQEAEKTGGLWQCPVDGCMHKVYAASEPSSQLLIKSHQSVHESDEDERIQLVRRMEAPWLPVNRLMDRVRGMAQREYQPPVVQRY